MNLEIFLILLLVANKFFCNCLEILPPEHYDEQVEEMKMFPIGHKPRPSPINLIRSSMITKRSWSPLDFSSEHSSEHEFTRKLVEGGLDVTFDFDGKKPNITGGVLKSTYEFEKLFFHWRQDDNGSYHTVNGKYFVMELQAYYRLIPRPSIFGGLLIRFFERKIRNTVIISQFFELNRSNNPDIETILMNGTRTSVNKLIKPLQEYATYKGSFVVSPFTEDVKWIISLTPLKISLPQLNIFRDMNKTTETSRAIQPLYGRKVFYVIP